MNSKKFSEALENVSESYIDCAAQVYESAGKKQRRNRRIFRAACAAAVVLVLLGGLFLPVWGGIQTAPGLLTITVRAVDENGVYTSVLEEGVSVPKRELGLVMGIFPGIPVRLSLVSEDFPEEDISFEVSVNHGYYRFFDDNNQLQEQPASFSCKNNTGIYWNIINEVTDFDENKDYDHIYTNITIYCKNHIIGYAVVRFDRIYKEGIPQQAYSAMLVESVTFPKIHWRYQNVSKEYVNQRFKALQQPEI